MYINTVESLPDTTITFTNGKKIVVLEKEEEMVEAIIQFYRTVKILGFRNDVEERS
ncbi:flagellar FlbD family protein [Peribacillus sp. RS7]|uniref:flagellar FlbD family protein n=1 Tax=Peribacillus sp. RS7 TaxID=3242679 RepID=UPI0035C08F2A